MRNPALSMRLQPRIHTDGPMATAVGRVLVARNPGAIPRLSAAVSIHRTQMQASAELVRHVDLS